MTKSVMETIHIVTKVDGVETGTKTVSRAVHLPKGKKPYIRDKQKGNIPLDMGGDGVLTATCNVSTVKIQTIGGMLGAF